MILEEPLSYPYAALAFLAIATALARRTGFWIAAAIVLSLVGGFIRGELGVLPVVLVLAAGLYALSSEAGRRWRSQFTAWDWVGAIVLGAGAVILFSGLVGKFSQSWAIATGHYQRAHARLRAAGCRGTDDRPRPAAGRRRDRELWPPRRATADARAPRVHEPVRRGGGRLRRLHGGQDRVPVHGRLHARRGAEPDLPRAARLRRHGAVDRPAAPALDPARSSGRVRRLPDRGDAVPARRPCPRATRPASRSPRWRTATSRSRTEGSRAR